MIAKSSRIVAIGVGAVLLVTGFTSCGSSNEDEAGGNMSKKDFTDALAANDFETVGDALKAAAANMNPAISGRSF